MQLQLPGRVTSDLCAVLTYSAMPYRKQPGLVLSANQQLQSGCTNL
jgi:hypothetical protein